MCFLKQPVFWIPIVVSKLNLRYDKCNCHYTQVLFTQPTDNKQRANWDTTKLTGRMSEETNRDRLAFPRLCSIIRADSTRWASTPPSGSCRDAPQRFTACQFSKCIHITLSYVFFLHFMQKLELPSWNSLLIGWLSQNDVSLASGHTNAHKKPLNILFYVAFLLANLSKCSIN